MSRIVVLGGGVVGLATGMLLARQGHRVTVLEHDGEPVPGSPEEAWQAWERRGVAQFRQPHFMQAGGRQILDRHLPDVKEALLRAGGLTLDLCARILPTISDRAPRAGDERFVTVTGRRPTIEYAFASAAERLVTVVRGASVAGLLTGPSAAPGIPHVAGVRTTGGREIAADLVVDATGRRSKLPEWLEAIGARRPIEEAEESGFLYYTRFFRSETGEVPAFRSGFLTNYHSYSILTLPGDPSLKALRDPERWTALIATGPLHAHLLDGEPITGVLPMGGVTDRYRRFVVDGAPVATGVVAVGDAWACTNPVGGRGMTIGLTHAVGTAEVVGRHLGNPLALAHAHDAMTEERVTPWYECTVALDRARAAQIRAPIEGRREPRPVDPAAALQVAMLHDAELFRAFLEITSLLALPQEVMARRGVASRIMELAGAHEAVEPPGPSRKALLRLVA